MKLFPKNQARLGSQRAITLVEMMITTTIFLMLTTAIVYTYIFALNLHENDRIKLSACDDARKTLVLLVDEVRSASKVKIGSGNETNFVECVATNIQTGNAIQIYPTNTTTPWVEYFYETNTGSSNFSKLVYTTSTNTGQTVVAIADAITNTFPLFSAEDAYGNPVSSNTNNVVIGVRLQFSQLEYPLVNTGHSNWSQNYQLHTRIARRVVQ